MEIRSNETTPIKILSNKSECQSSSRWSYSSTVLHEYRTSIIWLCFKADQLPLVALPLNLVLQNKVLICNWVVALSSYHEAAMSKNAANPALIKIIVQSGARAHNAMDPNVYCKDTEKIVYGVHLELAVQIQVYCLYMLTVYHYHTSTMGVLQVRQWRVS